MLGKIAETLGIGPHEHTGGPVRAVWEGVTVAESDETIVVEGNHYFPPDSVKTELLVDSSTHTTCPWKGKASYYSLKLDGRVNEDAAWYYPEPKSAADKIKGHVAFWRGVKVEPVPADNGQGSRPGSGA